MLRVPDVGFALSTNKHNGKLDLYADWIEASALFANDTVSRPDVLDALIENQTYQTQDFANQWISNVFRELERRFGLLERAGALVNEGDRIRRVVDWTERPAYSFCVALSVQPQYRRQVEAKCGRNYEEQGRLFERLCAESLVALRWDVAPLGWSRVTARSIRGSVEGLAAALGEPAIPGAISRWTTVDTKDAGVDLAVWGSFPDRWGGRPICLVQCASGVDWQNKLHSPNINTWKKLIDFSTEPRRGLAMPFAPGEDSFRLRANTDLLMLLLDRHRLLSPGRHPTDEFPSAKLANDLVKWTKKRVTAFPVEAP